MIDGEGLSKKAAELYRSLEDFSTWDKRDVIAILNTLMQLELERAQRIAQKPSK